VVKVGVHVRIGDFVADENSKVGYAIVDAGYLQRAFDYMESLVYARYAKCLIFYLKIAL
jgi:hypothetical protein